MISIRETLIVIKKIFPFFLLFIGKTVNSQVLPDKKIIAYYTGDGNTCLLYTSDAADERSSVDLGGRRIIKKKKKK